MGKPAEISSFIRKMIEEFREGKDDRRGAPRREKMATITLEK